MSITISRQRTIGESIDGIASQVELLQVNTVLKSIVIDMRDQIVAHVDLT